MCLCGTWLIVATLIQSFAFNIRINDRKHKYTPPKLPFK